MRLIQDDPSAPAASLHTIIYRIKDGSRLIEKIDMLNSTVASEKEITTEKNHQAEIPDLLGVRIICLRLADVGKIEGYLNLLAKEKIIRFVKGPEQKNTFVLPLDLGEFIPEGTDLRYTGYSSIHYRMQSGENANASEDLAGSSVRAAAADDPRGGVERDRSQVKICTQPQRSNEQAIFEGGLNQNRAM